MKTGETMEEEFLQKRFVDLANQSYRNNIYTFTGFLSASEQDLFYRTAPQIGDIGYSLFGGVEGCERQMLRFGSPKQFGYEEEFPICCMEIKPTAPKFADKLSHRDFLGALMNLGIERSMLGDIFITDKTGYVFCHEKVAEYMLANVDRIRHTTVKCRILAEAPEAVKPTLQEQNLIVSSERLDGIVAKLYHLSRSQSLLLFREKKVFVNGRCMENNSGVCKEGDIVSVRGFGKFVYRGLVHETKKGNLSIKLERYV